MTSAINSSDECQQPLVAPLSAKVRRLWTRDVLGGVRFLQWRYSRTVMQTIAMLISIVMIYHAFFGPQLAPKNLATLLTWVHFRGVVVIVAALAGNLFCMACPMMLPRELTRWIVKPKWNWPRPLRNKWPAIVLFVWVLFAYELFDLWASPWWTGILIVAYFTLATAVDTLFRGASFCKYVCPVGQFNFLSSTLSPTEVAVLDDGLCQRCTTKDCIRGQRSSSDTVGAELPVVQRGCELALFQPRKVGNVDCTFCLDCVYACPHDNVAIRMRVPGERIATNGTRSGLGTLERRSDFSALVVVFTFGALLNAFAMISPVYAMEEWIAARTGCSVEWPILAGMFAMALVLEPLLLLAGAAATSRILMRRQMSLAANFQLFARSLIPLGFAIWLAHYGFHFFTGFLTVVPVAQNAVRDVFGTAMLGDPMWQLGGLPESTVFVMEIGFLVLGLFGAATVAIDISQQGNGRMSGAIPWISLHVLLFVFALWILQQPMDMRGTFLGA